MMKPRRNDYLTEILLVLFLLLYFIILALFFTRPLLSHIYTHKVGHSGDSYYFMWIIGWFKQALFDLGQSPHHSHLLNHPYGFQLAQTNNSPLQVIFAEIVRSVLLGTNSFQIDPILDSDYQSLDIQFAGIFDEIAVFIIPDS